MRPARAAGLPWAMLATSAPTGRLSPRLSAISGVTDWRVAPSHGRLTALPPLLADETTAVSAASSDAQATELVLAEFRGPYFRLYGSDDVIGVEIGGALKNVIAIAAGVVPPGYGVMLSWLTSTIASGHGSRPNDDVRRVTGSPPASFADFAHRNARAWAVPAAHA